MRLSWFRAAYSLVATISDRRFDVTSDRTLHHSFGQPGDTRLQDGAHFEAPHHGLEAEVRDAALQYVRKVSGFSKPSAANAEAFDRAVDAVAAATMEMLAAYVTSAPPKDREAEAAKARARSAQRFAA